MEGEGIRTAVRSNSCRFVPLPENRSARLAVRRVLAGLAADRPRRWPNPLFLHGPPGLGKSHLAAELAADLGRRAPTRTARTVPAGDLKGLALADPLERAAGEALAELRGCDLLVLEDCQHLDDRLADTLGRLLDERAGRSRATVCTATDGPARLTHLPARLTSRLAGGLVVGLEPLSPASRRRLLESLARDRGLTVTADALDWLAGRESGVRPLVGLLNRLQTLRAAGVAPAVFDRDAVRAALDDAEPGNAVERVAHAVGRHFRLAVKELCGKGRQPAVLWARQVGMYVARRLTGVPLARIGAFYGGRDHSTVLNACRRVEQTLADDPAAAGEVRRLMAELG